MYNSVDLVKWPPGTQPNGDVACVAASTKYIDEFWCTKVIFSNMNPYPSKYWTRFDPPVTTKIARVVLDPFVYQPDWGTASDYGYPTSVTVSKLIKGSWTPETDDSDDSHHGEGYEDYGYEDYGYIPQSLVDHLLRNSDLSAAVFQGASLFPGGPEIDNCVTVLPVHAVAVDGLIDSSEETINVAGCFHPEACTGANELPVATTSVTEIVPQSVAALAQAKPSPPAAETSAAEIRGGKPEDAHNSKQGDTPGGQQAPAKVGQVSNTENEKAAPPIFPLQNSPTEQSNGGTPGQQFPPQPNPNPVAPAQKFNEVTPGQKSSSQPGLNPAPPTPNSKDGRHGSKSPSRPSSNPIAPVQDFHEATPGERSPPRPGSNAALSAPNEKGGTQGQNSPLQPSPRPRPVFVNKIQIAAQPLKTTPALRSTLFLLPSASALIVNGKTSPFAPAQTSRPFADIIAQGFNELKREQGRNSGPTPALVITVGNKPITANSASQFIVQGQTLAAGARPIVISGSTFSLAPAGSALVINGMTNTLSALVEAASSPAPVITIGDQPITANPASQFVVQGQTLAAAGGAIVVAGITFSLASSGSALIINGVMSALPTPFYVAPNPTPVITIGSQAVTENSASQFVVQGQTFKAGGTPIVVAGTTFSLAPFNSALVVNGVTSELRPPGMIASPIPTLTINDQVITADSQGQFLIGGQVLSPGGSLITIPGSTYSLAPSATAIVINGVTSALTNPETVVSPFPNLTINGQIITAMVPSKYVIDGQTLSPGGRAITVSGTIYSLTAYDSAIVVNGIPTPLQPAGLGSPRATNLVSEISELIIAGQTAIAGGPPVTVSGVSISLLPPGNEVMVGGSREIVFDGPTPVLTVGSQIVTATKEHEYIIGGQTLTPGVAATISGVRVSLASDGSDVVVQGTTIDLSTAGTTSQPGVAGFTGDGRKVRPEVRITTGLSFMVCLMTMMIIN